MLLAVAAHAHVLTRSLPALQLPAFQQQHPTRAALFLFGGDKEDADPSKCPFFGGSNGGGLGDANIATGILFVVVVVVLRGLMVRLLDAGPSGVLRSARRLCCWFLALSNLGRAAACSEAEFSGAASPCNATIPDIGATENWYLSLCAVPVLAIGLVLVIGRHAERRAKRRELDGSSSERVAEAATSPEIPIGVPICTVRVGTAHGTAVDSPAGTCCS